MKSTHTASRVLPSRWSSTPIFRRDPAMLSFDVFGFALSPAILDHDDVHRLVASLMARRLPYPVDDYVEVRRRAEAETIEHALAEGRPTIALAEISARLASLLAERGLDGSAVARFAITAELDYEQLVQRPSPDALRLYRDAQQRKLPVAFVADSYLPRDLVAKMLQRSGYHQGMVLVSSHEGCTKRSGRLYEILPDRTGLAAERILHLGPDPILDVARPAETGLAPLMVTSGRDHVRDRVELGLVERSGLDSMALALAADRFVEVEHEVSPTDIGYYASGPLLAGFASHVGQTIDELAPAEVVFAGPSGGLIRQVLAALRPDLDVTRFHDLEFDADQGPTLGQVGRLAAQWSPRGDAGVANKVLAVDLGWHGPTHRRLVELLSKVACDHQPEVPVVHACYLGLIDAGSLDDRAGVWAFDAGPTCRLSALAATGVPVLNALIPPTEARRARPLDGGRYGYHVGQLVAGILAFAEDFHDWHRLEPHLATPALTEPALRVLAQPTRAEADLLGRYRVADGAGERVTPLATLPPEAMVARNPKLLEQAAESAIWRQGFDALAEGDLRSATSARRFRRGLRRALPRDQAS